MDIEDLRELARRRVPRIAFNYIDGGAEGGWTLRENRRAFDTVTFRPHQAVAVQSCDLRTRVLGLELNWANPNQDYELAVSRFVKSVVESREFRDTFLLFQRKIAYCGMLNSLSQTLVKLTAPGVPDIYQGNELWKFSLVDPDNRRPVDYRARNRTLQLLKTKFESSHPPTGLKARELAQNMMVKLSCTRYGKCLACATRGPSCFAKVNTFHCGSSVRKRNMCSHLRGSQPTRD